MSKKASKMDFAHKDLAEAFNAPLPPELLQKLQKAHALEKWPIAQLISVFERNTEANFVARHQLISFLENNEDEFGKQGCVLGITGTPGAGKSSLIGELCLSLLEKKPDISIAVLAIDPSSHDSGGALLGDRTRTIFPVKDKRLFFRSQASAQDLGGMNKRTYHVTRLLRRLFDIVIIETVGIGQNEIEVQNLSDHTFLVMQPLAGDQVQFMKAGIMEVPDTFVINKCDEDALAKKSLHLLKSSLKLASIYVENSHVKNKGEKAKAEARDVFLTSAIKRKGVDELGNYLLEIADNEVCAERLKAQEQYFLNKSIVQAYGEFGNDIFDHFKDDIKLQSGSLEQKEWHFGQLISDFVKRPA